MKFSIALSLLFAALFFSQVSRADSFTIIQNGKSYLCQQQGGNDDSEIALVCYDRCRDQGSSHPYCESICNAHGVTGVKASCYRRCINEGSSDPYCRSICE